MTTDTTPLIVAAAKVAALLAALLALGRIMAWLVAGGPEAPASEAVAIHMQGYAAGMGMFLTAVAGWWIGRAP